MMDDKKPQIALKDIYLFDYTPIKISIETLNLEKERVKEKVSLGLNVSIGEAEIHDGIAKSCSATLQVTISPVDNEAPYKIECILEGRFATRKKSSYSEDELLDYVQIEGIEELYGIAKALIGSATSMGAFGPYILPSISIEND